MPFTTKEIPLMIFTLIISSINFAKSNYKFLENTIYMTKNNVNLTRFTYSQLHLLLLYHHLSHKCHEDSLLTVNHLSEYRSLINNYLTSSRFHMTEN